MSLFVCANGHVADSKELYCPKCNKVVGELIHNPNQYEAIMKAYLGSQMMPIHVHCAGIMDTTQILDKTVVHCRKCGFRTELKKED